MALLNTIFINSDDIEYLTYILYNKTNKTYKIKCKSICDFLKEKIQTKVKTNISQNKNLFYHIFHEIRNYLNIITISTDNLSSLIDNKFNKEFELFNINLDSNVLSDNAEIEQSINFIKDSSKTIIEIISDVLTLEKLISNKINIRKTFFMLDDLINSCVYSTQTSANNKEISFIFENKIGSISIYGDYIRLKQVIINLISNAIKFTNKDGKVEFIIDLEEIEHNEKKIKFIVKDNGIGIKKENHDSVFIDFFQINPEKLQNGGGTGLGLSIAKTIVELHDGNIGFNSEYNYGTEFYFTIPLIENEPINLSIENKTISNNDLRKSPIQKSPTQNLIYNEKISKQESEKSIFCSKIRNDIYESRNQVLNDFSMYKILFVDDNKTIQKISYKIFESIGITEIYIASNGLEAYEIYEKQYLINQPFNLVLMDQQMPVMDGNISSNKIIQLDSNAIIVGLTGNTLVEQKDEFLKNGVKEVYEKPITKEKLIQLLIKYKNL